MEAIILAGGLGTRLRSEVPDLPKCMAPVNGKPFIAFVIDECIKEGVSHFIFSLGYRSDVIIQFLESSFTELSYDIVIEEEPLGTGGAIQLACSKATTADVIVCNGDTLFKVDLQALMQFHVQKNANCTLALKPMKAFDRYGVVELHSNGSIASFQEKKYYEQGLINGGVYILNVAAFREEHFPLKFSFEKEYLEAKYQKGKMFGLQQDAYFIDIGIPEDFKRAQIELA